MHHAGHCIGLRDFSKSCDLDLRSVACLLHGEKDSSSKQQVISHLLNNLSMTTIIFSMSVFIGCFWILFLKNSTDSNIVRPSAQCSLFSFHCFQFFFILFSSNLCTQGLDSHYTGREAPSRHCQLAATIRSQWENYRYTFALPSTLLSLLLF